MPLCLYADSVQARQFVLLNPTSTASSDDDERSAVQINLLSFRRQSGLFAEYKQPSVTQGVVLCVDRFI